jgi:quinol-cytochrome oxidoreductase complex cytochrome b subunit
MSPISALPGWAFTFLHETTGGIVYAMGIAGALTFAFAISILGGPVLLLTLCEITDKHLLLLPCGLAKSTVLPAARPLRRE